jgi:hypothetical protein
MPGGTWIQPEPDPRAYSNLGFIAYEEGRYQEADERADDDLAALRAEREFRDMLEGGPSTNP